MNSRFYKILLVLAAVALLAAGGQFMKMLNRERLQLGFTPLPDDPAMPPVLALTTQALGGFRGLIANALWIRANDLQLADKFFEMVQLADWITKLEPHFAQVWIVQAWNMAFNISVKFPQAEDRWRWVQRGIELLRDDGLRYNPDEPLIYRELAWIFQFKMGQNLDDAHFYYKAAWAAEMTQALGAGQTNWNGRPNYEVLLNPTTPEEQQHVATLREDFRLDPRKMKEVDDRYGPFDWRLPEAHAIYWAYLGLAKSKPQDLIILRRVIYQSMQLAFQRGRLRISPRGQPYLAPNFDMVANAHAAYAEMTEQETDAAQRDGIKRAHRNFLRQVVYELYIHNRISEAERWLTILRDQFPDAVPPGIRVADYAVNRAMGEMQEGGQVRVTSLIQAFITQSYLRLIEGEDDEAAAYMQRAQEIRDAYTRRVGQGERVRLTPLPEVKKQVVEMLLNPDTGLSAEARARLRTKLGLPAETTSPEAK